MAGVQSPVLQAWLPVASQAIDWGVHLPKVSGVGAEAADRGAGPPRFFGSVHPGSHAADLDAH